MEVDDVLANKVMYLGAGVRRPKIVKVQVAVLIAQVLEARHVANGGVHPDIKILICGARNGEAKVGGVTRDIPGAQTVVQPLGQLVGNLGLHGAAAGPRFEEVRIAP